MESLPLPIHISYIKRGNLPIQVRVCYGTITDSHSSPWQARRYVTKYRGLVLYIPNQNLYVNDEWRDNSVKHIIPFTALRLCSYLVIIGLEWATRHFTYKKSHLIINISSTRLDWVLIPIQPLHPWSFGIFFSFIG